MKTISTLLFALALCNVSAAAQAKEKTITVTVENTWNKAKSNEPVVINLKEVAAAFPVQSAVVWDGATEIPSQLDDMNRDWEVDELAFVIDMPARSTKTLKVVLSDQVSNRHYTPRTHAQMRLSDKNQKHPHALYLTIPGSTLPKEIYSAMYHHGPAFESELTAFRVYFDNRQSVDLYGKKKQRLELAETNFYTTKAQRAEDYGCDVLWAGTSVGLGSFRGWENGQPQYIDKVDSRSAGVLSSGPVRAVVEMADQNWQYQGKKLSMVQHYIIYAGHRDVNVQVRFKESSVKENTFCSGVQKLERDNVGFLQADGLAGSWGSNLPEKKDTITNPRETVGLGFCIPKANVKTVKEDEHNYLVVFDTHGGKTIDYHFTFNSAKEEKGMKDSKTWFAYLKEWQQALQHPCKITIKP